MSILQINNLDISYKEKNILENVNLTVEKNEIISIMGNSGSGKSTFLSCLNGFLSENGGQYSGEILFDGTDISQYKLIDLRRQISMLFQDSTVFDMSIEKNLAYTLEYFHGKNYDKKTKIEQILKSVNLYEELKDNLKMNANKLSGGQKQRLCIARMLTTNPKILIFDEPCSSLDLQNTLAIENLLKNLSQKYTIIISTHNTDQAQRISDRILFIEDKKLVEHNEI